MHHAATGSCFATVVPACKPPGNINTCKLCSDLLLLQAVLALHPGYTLAANRLAMHCSHFL
jgi:hypothetical protein